MNKNNNILEIMCKHDNQNENKQTEVSKKKQLAKDIAKLGFCLVLSTVPVAVYTTCIMPIFIKADDNVGLYYDELKTAYICEVENDSLKQSIFLLRENIDDSNLYYVDAITNTVFNTEQNKVVSKESVCIWLNEMNRVQDWYSKDELKEFLADVEEEKEKEKDINNFKVKTYVMTYDKK